MLLDLGEHRLDISFLIFFATALNRGWLPSLIPKQLLLINNFSLQVQKWNAFAEVLIFCIVFVHFGTLQLPEIDLKLQDIVSQLIYFANH